MAVHDEGVIKFAADHSEEPLDPRRFGELVSTLLAWREILVQTGLVGQEPERYGGFAYGNVSARVGPPSAARRHRSFLISGSGTAGRREAGLLDFALVEAYDAQRNHVVSRGPCLPSSESMTHGAVYDLGPHVRFVFHVHSPAIWRRARDLRLPTTDPRAAYGTPAMAAEVERLWSSTALSDKGIFAMGGHEDGVVVFGRSAEEAGTVLLRFLAQAYQQEAAGRTALRQ